MVRAVFLISALVLLPWRGEATEPEQIGATTAVDQSQSAGAHQIPADTIGGDYFPLEDGRRYEYVGRYNGKTDRPVLRSRKHEVGDTFFYYFDEEGDNQLLTGCMFGLGAYKTTTDGVLTVRVRWPDQLNDVNFDRGQMLLEQPIKVGNVNEVKDGEYTARLVVEKFESIRVPAGLFHHCARIRIEETYPDTKYTSRIWLAKAVGLVKWQRSTGRIDELVSVSPRKPID